LNASAAAWPVAALAAVLAALHAVTVSAEALHLLTSWSQLKSEMTLMFNALPWLKSAWLTAWKLFSLRPSRPAANSIAMVPRCQSSCHLDPSWG
jgi:hypothetical protein